jgi:hypothetical protein
MPALQIHPPAPELAAGTPDVPLLPRPPSPHRRLSLNGGPTDAPACPAAPCRPSQSEGGAPPAARPGPGKPVSAIVAPPPVFAPGGRGLAQPWALGGSTHGAPRFQPSSQTSLLGGGAPLSILAARPLAAKPPPPAAAPPPPPPVEALPGPVAAVQRAVEAAVRPALAAEHSRQGGLHEGFEALFEAVTHPQGAAAGT